MALRDALSNTFIGAAVLCAVVSTALMVRREFRPLGASTPINRDPTPVKDWQRYAVTGHRMGPASARVTILEFADFECPVCRSFTTGPLEYVRSKHPDDIQVVFRHWPLSYHRFAYPAARASECAAAQGRFDAFHDLIYAKQDSLGLKPFSGFAREAGVSDSAAFDRCNTTPGSVLAIDADVAAARVIGGHGTPTIVINGLMLAGAPDSLMLERLVNQALRTTR
jgi:protein-disulfide isomerase